MGTLSILIVVGLLLCFLLLLCLLAFLLCNGVWNLHCIEARKRRELAALEAQLVASQRLLLQCTDHVTTLEQHADRALAGLLFASDVHSKRSNMQRHNFLPRQMRSLMIGHKDHAPRASATSVRRQWTPTIFDSPEDTQ